MATFYIDPTATGVGTGTQPDPFQSWASVTWAAGNSYLQKAGTTAAETITPSASGTAASRITIGRYGVGANPAVGSGQTRGIFLSARQYIDIVGVNVSGATTEGVHIRTNGSNIQSITLTDCVSSGNGSNGFFLDGQVLTAALDNVTFTRCEAYDNQEHGFDTLGIIRGVTWIDCKAANNGATVLGHGFSLHPFISNNIVSGWTATGVGTSYSRATSASEDVQKVICLTDGTILTKNAGAGSAVTSGQWDQASPGATLYINVGADPNTKTTAWKRAPHGPFTYFNCTSWDNLTTAGPGEGHGFAADDMTSNATYYGCRAYGNEGAGFQAQYTNDIRYFSCVAERNDLSNYRTTGYTQGLYYYNCIASEAVQHGFFAASPFTSVEMRNCIAVGNGRTSASYYGLIGASVGITASNNCTYLNGASGTNNTSNVTNTNGVVADPGLNNRYLPTNSALVGAGTYVGGLDYYGKECPIAPNIGAVQSWPARTAGATRSTQTRSTATRIGRTRSAVTG